MLRRLPLLSRRLAAPKVLAANSGQEMAAAVSVMLAALKGSSTRLADPARDELGDYSRVVPRTGDDALAAAMELARSGKSERSGLFYKAANGDVTSFSVPGGIHIGFSGHDVRWPDGRQLQRVGLTPDVLVSPTIAGIRAGKHEVLDRAIPYLEAGK